MAESVAWLDADAILLPVALPVPRPEVEAILEDVFALLEPCFCCFRENPEVLSFEKSRLFRSLLLKEVTFEVVVDPGGSRHSRS